MKRTITLLAAAASMILGSSTVSAKDHDRVQNVVLVHGAAMDGSSWRKVYDILIRKHYTVSVVQLPLSGPGADIAATRKVIARQNGPVVLVGHSYGGPLSLLPALIQR